MHFRRMLPLVVGAMLAGRLAGLSAQEPTAAAPAADTTVQGYVPATPAPPAAAPTPAVAPAPAPAPAAAPAPVAAPAPAPAPAPAAAGPPPS